MQSMQSSRLLPLPGLLLAIVSGSLMARASSPRDTDQPNELGRVPILMYHSVGEYNTAYDRHGLNITPSLFRKHMDLLYRNGFYPVNLRDLTNPRLAIPKGKTPVVLTFDDARGSQFRYKNGRIDPDCVVGILDAMHKKHGDAWPQRAVFFVLPKSRYNPVPFHQEGKEQAKVKYLVDAGYEIANHSTSHRPFSRLNAKELAWEVTHCQQYFRKIDPRVTIDTMAVPYGIFPKTPALRDILTANGNRLVCMAWGDASYAPLDKRFDRKSVMRVGSEPGNIERWIQVLVAARRKPGSSLAPYVSDGDTTTLTLPASRMKFVNRPETNGMRLVTFADAPAEATVARTKTKPEKKRKPSSQGKPIVSSGR
ncbi:MAG: polysaccharide deacetylase family protein [Capsulimonadales bacterium]|nr:polysaccharide deacetylase family protein [Capsulimonadales bacterium]